MEGWKDGRKVGWVLMDVNPSLWIHGWNDEWIKRTEGLKEGRMDVLKDVNPSLYIHGWNYEWIKGGRIEGRMDGCFDGCKSISMIYD